MIVEAQCPTQGEAIQALSAMACSGLARPHRGKAIDENTLRLRFSSLFAVCVGWPSRAALTMAQQPLK
jgi:hypothetical protein